MKIPFTNIRVFERPAVVASKSDTSAALSADWDRTAAELLEQVRDWANDRPDRMEVVKSVREVADLNRRLLRAYDSALTDNYNSDLRGTYGSPNTEMFPSKYKSRANSRTLAKDTPHGRAIIRTLADNVVGDDPFDLEMKVGKKTSEGFEEEEDTNDWIETAWRHFLWKENFTIRKTMSAMEAWRVAEMERATAGNCICRMYPGYEFNEFRFAVDFLEEDRLQEQFCGKSGSDGMFGAGNPIRASIEYHPQYNFPLAYWILRRHPGEFFNQADTSRDGDRNFREQVPASQVILFSNLRERAEQDMGMTELAATVQAQWKNQQYTRSLTVAAIVSCIRAFVLEKKLPTGIPSMPPEQMEQFYNMLANVGSGTTTGSEDPAQTQQNAGVPAKVWRPGEERALPPGVEAKVLSAEFPIEAAHEFIQDNLREIAVGASIPFQEISGDYQNLGFIAGLMCKQPFHRNMRIRQNSFIEDLRTLFRAWLRSTILSGYFDRRGQDVSILRLEEFVMAARFKGQQWEFVNPLVQAQALILLNQAGHMTRQQVQDALPCGMKIHNLFSQLKQEKKEETLHGLELDAESAGEPTAEDVSGNPKNSGSDDAPAKSKKQNPRSRGLLRGIDSTTRALLEMSTNGQH